MAEKSKSRGLGRGLNALFEDDEAVMEAMRPEAQTSTTSEAAAPSTGTVRDIQKLGTELLEPGAMQPRFDFDAEALEALAASIRTHGVLQPLLVRPKRDPISGEELTDRYEIIAGERRWRAAQIAQLHELPVVIRSFEDAQAMQIALIENLQREDLNPVEEALGYQRLMDEHSFTQSQLAEALGRSRSHIANMTRMLSLPESILDMVRHGALSAGHARALIPLEKPEKVAEKIVANQLSVRETEKLVQSLQGKGQTPDKEKKKEPSKAVFKDPDLLALESELSNQLGVRFVVDSSDCAKGGTIKIEFKSMDQLNDLIDLLRAEKLEMPTQAQGKRLLD